ncbi:hypothetical protein DL767_010601 [Monosporascus sp. MG133]|nr:hypothetical protein DL767_010601 [Monosporascus sp. MG133]
MAKASSTVTTGRTVTAGRMATAHHGPPGRHMKLPIQVAFAMGRTKVGSKAMVDNKVRAENRAKGRSRARTSHLPMVRRLWWSLAPQGLRLRLLSKPLAPSPITATTVVTMTRRT